MRYGEDYRSPCIKIAVDILNDAATKYDANKFFFENDAIAFQMQQMLNSTFQIQCNSQI